MRTCNRFEKMFVAYLHGELEERQADRLQSHLESCASCRAEFESQRATLGLLDESLALAPAPEKLSPWRSLHRASHAAGTRFEHFWYSPQLKSALAAGVVAALFLVISGSIVVFRILPKRHDPVTLAISTPATETKPQVPVDIHSLPKPEVSPSRIASTTSALATPPATLDYPSDRAKSGTDDRGFSADGRVGYLSVLNQGAGGNAQPGNTEQYDWIPENSFKMAYDNPLSTFSIDVDRAAYANIRRFLNENRMPPPDAVRIEEMINYFAYDYPEPNGEDPFAISMEVAACPWNGDHELALIGLQGIKVDHRDLPPNNLVFLLDVSGSMDQPDKLPLLKSAMQMLVDELRPQDRVSIVVYAGAAGVVLEPTSDHRRIVDALDRLQAGGSTAGGAGIELAYRMARDSFLEKGNNRVILATDGDFNVGVSSDGELVRLIEEERRSGVYLTVLGFGSGNLKDSRMEKLADTGNGNYAYIDNLLEARKTLVSEMGGTLLTIAKDVKIQVEFNPGRVKAYRLIGYENRVMANEDFNDDRKDAGELGAGHTVTALYELIPAGSDEAVPEADELRYQTAQLTGSDDLMTVKLRYKRPDSEESRLLVRSVRSADYRNRRPSDNFRFASQVAEFGLLLRGSAYKGDANYDQVIRLATANRGEDAEGYRAEFIRLVEKARSLDSDASE